MLRCQQIQYDRLKSIPGLKEKETWTIIKLGKQSLARYAKLIAWKFDTEENGKVSWCYAVLSVITYRLLLLLWIFIVRESFKLLVYSLHSWYTLGVFYIQVFMLPVIYTWTTSLCINGLWGLERDIYYLPYCCFTYTCNRYILERTSTSFSFFFKILTFLSTNKSHIILYSNLKRKNWENFLSMNTYYISSKLNTKSQWLVIWCLTFFCLFFLNRKLTLLT